MLWFDPFYGFSYKRVVASARHKPAEQLTSQADAEQEYIWLVIIFLAKWSKIMNFVNK
jgi:hypothetical protein